MVSKAEIVAKYKELHKEYGDKHIDDYDAFVRSRVIEYYYRLYPSSVDELIMLINSSMEKQEQTFIPVIEQEITIENEGSTMDNPAVMNSDSSSDSYKAKSLFPVLLLPVSAIAGLLAYIFRRNN